MFHFKQFDALKIQELTEKDDALQFHHQNYHELIFVKEGRGSHYLNHTKMDYQPDDLMIASPEDQHSFRPNSETKLVVIKFTNDYFQYNFRGTLQNLSELHPEEFMEHPILKEQKLTFDKISKAMLRETIGIILKYNATEKKVATSPFIFHQILSIFGLIKENFDKSFLSPGGNLYEKEKLTAYIHRHIYNPKKLKKACIAQYFNISLNYFGSYFKQKFGVSYREYLYQVRLSLIEKRLESGRISIKELAHEFGFSDESHFSHFYKNKRGITPTEFIKSKSS